MAIDCSSTTIYYEGILEMVGGNGGNGGTGGAGYIGGNGGNGGRGGNKGETNFNSRYYATGGDGGAAGKGDIKNGQAGLKGANGGKYGS